MAQDNDDIQVPNLGPAEPSSVNRSAEVAETPRREVESSSGGGNSLIQSLVIIILIASVSALGYFGFDMYQLQLEREGTLKQAQAQITQLQDLLKKAEQGAAESGEAIQGNVTSIEAALKQKDKQLDSEIAKLWVIANEKNKPALAKQAKEITELKKQVSSQQALLAEQKKQLSKQASENKSLKADLDAKNKNLLASIKKYDQQFKSFEQTKSNVAVLKKSLGSDLDKFKATLNDEVAKLSKLVARVETEMRAGAELSQEQQDDLVAKQRTLSDRLVKLEGKSTSGLERRVSLNEQAVRAFDSTRLQLNQDLLRVKQKLNNMQLMLEQK